VAPPEPEVELELEVEPAEAEAPTEPVVDVTAALEPDDTPPGESAIARLRRLRASVDKARGPADEAATEVAAPATGAAERLKKLRQSMDSKKKPAGGGAETAADRLKKLRGSLASKPKAKPAETGGGKDDRLKKLLRSASKTSPALAEDADTPTDGFKKDEAPTRQDEEDGAPAASAESSQERLRKLLARKGDAEADAPTPRPAVPRTSSPGGKKTGAEALLARMKKNRERKD